MWDGARGHRSELVERVGVQSIVQPSYSLEHNSVERVFEEIRRWMEGRLYKDIEDKLEAVNVSLRELDPGRVCSLT